MEFTVAKGILQDELSLMQGVVDKKATVPILGNVLVSAAGEEVRIAGTDLEIALRSSFPATVTHGGAVTVSAKRLFEIVRLLPEQPIKFKMGDDSNFLTVTCGKSRFRLAGLSQLDFPALAETIPNHVNLPAKALSTLIDSTVFAISTEDAKYTLNGGLLLLGPKRLGLVTTDGHRLALVEAVTYDGAPISIEGVEPLEKVLVPKKALVELNRLINEDDEQKTVAFASDDNHLFFQVGKRLLIARKLVGKFPDFEAVLPKNDRAVTVPRVDLSAAVSRVALFSDERSHSVKLALTPGKLEVTAAGSDLGEAQEAIDVDYQGEEISIGFNHKYLLDYLKQATVGNVRLSFRDSESAVDFSNEQRTVFSDRYVVMPMRV